jgi:hypothetical protein
MAIITTNIEIGGRKLVKHESDRGVYIRQVETGIEYSSAVDIVPCRFNYEETEKVIGEGDDG